MKFLNKIQ